MAVLGGVVFVDLKAGGIGKGTISIVESSAEVHIFVSLENFDSGSVGFKFSRALGELALKNASTFSIGISNRFAIEERCDWAEEFVFNRVGE